MLNTISYILPAYWASYLVNGDDSGIEAADKAAADKFLTDHNLPAPCSCSDESWFAWNDDATLLGGDVMEYTFSIPSQDNQAVIN